MNDPRNDSPIDALRQIDALLASINFPSRSLKAAGMAILAIARIVSDAIAAYDRSREYPGDETMRAVYTVHYDYLFGEGIEFYEGDYSDYGENDEW